MFEPERGDKVTDLTKYHLPLPLISKLKEFFLDRVDPMMKFLHLPTFWAALANELPNPDRIPKSLEALIFAFYLVSICSLKEDEAQELFGVELQVLLYRYRVATRQALVNARFLSTANLMTLQAFSIFIVCSYSQPLPFNRFSSTVFPFFFFFLLTRINRYVSETFIDAIPSLFCPASPSGWLVKWDCTAMEHF